MPQVPELAPAPSETFSGGKGTIVVSQRSFRISHRPIKGQDLHGHNFVKCSQSEIGGRRFGLTSVMCTLETIVEGSSSRGAQVKNFVMIAVHQENSKLLIFYLICLNPLNLKLSKIREEKRRGLDLFFLLFLNLFLIVLKST